MQYTSRTVANSFILKSDFKKIGHLELQKLLFFMHAWSLTLTGQSVLSEKPQAWQYGPIFVSIYYELKSHGSGKITQPLEEFCSSEGKLLTLQVSKSDKAFWTLLDQVVSRYASFTGLQLSALAHEKNGPWEYAYNLKMLEIPDDIIVTNYIKKYKLETPPQTLLTNK